MTHTDTITPEGLSAIDAKATPGELSVFGSTIHSERFYIGTDMSALGRSEIGTTRYADFELYATLVNLYRSGRLVILPRETRLQRLGRKLRSILPW